MDDRTAAAENVPNVLVVDDSPANLTMLCKMLKESGLRTRPVPTGQLALEAAAKSPPDLILLDVNMPGMDGYEVCARLKGDESLRDIPVIFVSALGETGDKVRGFTAGGVDYITKPFRLEEVVARVRTHLDLRRQKRQLMESYERLKELESLRDSLVHMIVHDMRSPLMGIGSCLEALNVIEGETLRESGHRLLTEARATTARLIEMVGALLDVSRMESKAMPLRLASCDARALVEAAASRAEAFKGTGRLALDIGADTPGLVCDEDMIQRVLQNLLVNAYQFAPAESEILVTVESRPHETKFCVADHGPGIPPEYLGLVFDKFGQVATGKIKRAYSTGLGLAFCRLAVEAHGGLIGVESTVGKGSTFWFTLPQEPHGGAAHG